MNMLIFKYIAYNLLFVLLGIVSILLIIRIKNRLKPKCVSFRTTNINHILDKKKLIALSIGAVQGEQFHCSVNSLSTGLSYWYIDNIMSCKGWHIYDHGSAIRELDWLYMSGTRDHFKKSLFVILDKPNTYESLQLLDELFRNDPNADEIMNDMTNFNKRYERMLSHILFPFGRKELERGILSWDMAEVVLLARFSYDLGFIDENEAWNYIEKAYENTEGAYNSWQQFATGLVIGAAMKYCTDINFNEYLSEAEKVLTSPASPWVKNNFHQIKSVIICERKMESLQSITSFMILCICICSTVFMGCKNSHSESSDSETDSITANVSAFKYPEIPDTIKTKEQRLNFLLEHYWEIMDFNDTSLIHKPEILEQAFTNYLVVLKNIPTTSVEKGIEILMQRAAMNWDMQNFIIDLFEKYLYDPNSPMRDEELYIPVLKYILDSPTVRSEDMIMAEFRLKMALKNRVGQKATDFTFKDRHGRLHKLSEIKNDYILLYFNNPGCHACQQVTKMINQSPTFHDARLTIVAVYADDDVEEWKKCANDIPSEWVNVYSPGGNLMKKELYDLKAIPTLYLLDGNGVVLFKDAIYEQIENYLEMHLTIVHPVHKL